MAVWEKEWMTLLRPRGLPDPKELKIVPDPQPEHDCFYDPYQDDLCVRWGLCRRPSSQDAQHQRKDE